MINLFHIVFEDGSTFSGGDLINTKWAEISDKKIRTIFYHIPNGETIAMSGYDKYGHFVEATQDLTGENKGKVNIEFTYLLGKIDNQVRGYKINIKTGDLQRINLSEEDNLIKEINKTIWK